MDTCIIFSLLIILGSLVFRRLLARVAGMKRVSSKRIQGTSKIR